MVLDAEMVIVDGVGRVRFEQLVRRSRLRSPVDRARCAQHARGAVGFDLLELEGRDLRASPLLERKRALNEVLFTSAQRIRPIDYVLTFGTELFKVATAAKLGGLLAKRADSQYRRGLSGDWVKIRTAHVARSM